MKKKEKRREDGEKKKKRSEVAACSGRRRAGVLALVHVLAGAACALRRGAIDVLQIEWNRRKLRSAAPACVTLKRVALLLERFGLVAYLVGRPYLPLNFGYWHDAYEAAELPCPPRCTGDVVGLRQGWAAREAVARELTAPPARRFSRGPRSRPSGSPFGR